MTLGEKLAGARQVLRDACEALLESPSSPGAWADLCRAKARLVALQNCGGR